MDSYTSEVHATLNSCPETDGGHIARIRVSRPSRAFSSEVTPIIFDEDGDLMRESSRQTKEEEILLLLRHSCAPL
ncbi:Methyltransferaselike protein 22like [Caligus rogercresseyi]|uniref:Methyltransferaselike protein 22like n=1 Tax=Caligus rogercresseyi TaxID=217165 RepID=A0A7T8KI49_CALRO|nr:Methyltransferaselike protein 22like [Caligus rogercresseyi]